MTCLQCFLGSSHGARCFVCIYPLILPAATQEDAIVNCFTEGTKSHREFNSPTKMTQHIDEEAISFV